MNLKQLEGAPNWFITSAVKNQHDENCSDAYEIVEESSVPRMRISSNHTLCTKFRHGNRYREKDEIRKDASTAQFHVIRLMLALVTKMYIWIGLVEVKGACIQSGPIKRKLYVREPLEWYVTPRVCLWRLKKYPYGISEVGRQWAISVEEWLLMDMLLESLYGVSQLFARRKGNVTIYFLLVKVTDENLFAG